MKTLTLTKVGNSTGLIVPKDVLTKLKLEAGDKVYLTDGPDGVRLTPYDPTFEKQMETYEKVAKKRRSMLRELAK